LIAILITLNRFGKLCRRQVCAIVNTMLASTIGFNTIGFSTVFGSAIAGVTPLFRGGID
jgi:hypothetical protein